MTSRERQERYFRQQRLLVSFLPLRLTDVTSAPVITRATLDAPDRSDGGESAPILAEMASSSSSSGSPAGYAVGIDEAGRGPVLGPLVYGAAYCPVDRQAQLADLGVADSKTLTADDRERLLAAIDACAFLRYELDAIPSATISALMLRRRKYNLNLISHDSAVGLVRRIMASGVAVAEIYVDTVGDPDKYERKLSALFPQAKCVVRKKADSLFPIVSAASICAKVGRRRRRTTMCTAAAERVL